MSKQSKNIISDLQGAAKLTTETVKGVTNVVESLHSTIASFTRIFEEPKQKGQESQKAKTSGITGMVYKNIRTLTDIFGGGIDITLNKLSSIVGEKQSSKGREAIVAAMNGIVGDHLHNSENPLAIKMSLRLKDSQKSQSLSPKKLKDIIQQSNGKLLIMIHGLCMNDIQFNRDGHNHGELLSEQLGYTTLYLHYNTGRHVSENGREFSQLLDDLFSNISQNISLDIVAHSMGGLLSRSACYYAEKDDHTWLTNLDKMVFLGTPHHGALLAKGGHWADILLQISPYSAPFAKITKVRSNGLTDLRYGNIIDEDWDSDGVGDTREIIPLPKGVSCYAIATSSSDKQPSKLTDDVIGDGLVTVKSALGQHKNQAQDLHITKANQWQGRNINHMQLLSDKGVYNVVKGWLIESK